MAGSLQKIWRLLAVLLLSTLPAAVQAQFTLATNAGNKLSITGYAGSGGNAVIPSTTNGMTVTSIADNAFKDESTLTGITIPSSVISIGTNAFRNCTFLTNATIGSSVNNGGNIPTFTTIGNFAFYSCTRLTSVSLPYNVTNLGSSEFAYCSGLANITIPTSVTNLADSAFGACASLTGIYFKGNAPSHGSNVFSGDLATVYYLPGTTNWSATYAGLPAVLWNPQAQTNDASFGVRTNQFGFNITGSSNLVIVVEACTNLVSPAWSVVATNTLDTFSATNGSSYFSDSRWTNYPSRFYRFRAP